MCLTCCASHWSDWFSHRIGSPWTYHKWTGWLILTSYQFICSSFFFQVLNDCTVNQNLHIIGMVIFSGITHESNTLNHWQYQIISCCFIWKRSCYCTAWLFLIVKTSIKSDIRIVLLCCGKHEHEEFFLGNWKISLWIQPIYCRLLGQHSSHALCQSVSIVSNFSDFSRFTRQTSQFLVVCWTEGKTW